MSLRLEMLQVARLAPRLLGESAELIVRFLHSQLNDDGGFKDRAGQSDLYYTVFGLEALAALGASWPAERVAHYLRSFGDGAGLDLVHLACLARCWANLPPPLRVDAPAVAILDRIERHRCHDGGYQAAIGAARGTVYGCFLALGACQDLHLPMPRSEGLLDCLQSLRANDGGYANQAELPMGLTPATAAAVRILRQLSQPIEAGLAEWLLSRCRADGGFFATPMAPIPDLLSTATALHALGGLHADIEPIREPCLDFIDTLWTSRGSFFGNWTEDVLDCEYTYYGLLALGHLA